MPKPINGIKSSAHIKVNEDGTLSHMESSVSLEHLSPSVTEAIGQKIDAIGEKLVEDARRNSAHERSQHEELRESLRADVQKVRDASEVNFASRVREQVSKELTGLLPSIVQQVKDALAAQPASDPPNTRSMSKGKASGGPSDA